MQLKKVKETKLSKMDSDSNQKQGFNLYCEINVPFVQSFVLEFKYFTMGELVTLAFSPLCQATNGSKFL